MNNKYSIKNSAVITDIVPSQYVAEVSKSNYNVGVVKKIKVKKNWYGVDIQVLESNKSKNIGKTIHIGYNTSNNSKPIKLFLVERK